MSVYCAWSTRPPPHHLTFVLPSSHWASLFFWTIIKADDKAEWLGTGIVLSGMRDDSHRDPENVTIRGWC